MSDLGDTLTKQVGPLPLGVWLLVGAGGLVIARQQSKADLPDVTKEIQQVPVPVGAIASPDGAPTVINVVVYNPKPDAVTPTPTVTPPATTPPATTPPVVAPPVLTPKPTVAAVAKPAVAVKPTISATTKRTYTVVRGDTLSEIGARFGIDWRRIYSANTAKIEATARAHGRVSSSGGHWIYPGTVLVIP